MNILQHILAGHYPVDEKGRALVPTKDGGTLVVCATDRPGSCPIVGWKLPDGYAPCWGYFPDSESLLPPPPRKVEVKAWASCVRGGTINKLHFHQSFAIADACENNGFTVELTGSYEEPWS